MVVTELFAKLGIEVDEGAFEKVEHALKSAKGLMLALGGAAAAVGAGLYELARETANAGEETERAAQRTMLTTDAYQELKFAAEESGVSVGGLESALFKMSRAAYEAKQGSTEAAKSFQGLLSLKDLKELSPDQQLEKLADGFLKIKDPGERAAKVMGVFGRGGAELIPLLSRGSEGIAEFRQKAHELGVVLDEETIKNAKEFNERAREMTARLEGLKYAIGSRVLGVLVKFGRWFEKFKKEHAEGIFQALKFAVMGLAAAIVYFAAANAAAIASAITWYAALAIQAVVAWLAVAAPIAIVIAGIAVLLLWLEDLYQFLTGGDSVIGDFVAAIKDSFQGGLMGFLKDFGAWLLHFLPDTFVEACTSAAKRAWEILTGAWAKIKGFIQHPIDSVFGGGSPPTGSGFSGGASSPAASVAASPSLPGGKQVNVNAPNTITINTHPGMSADQIVDAMDRKIQDHHDRVEREALAGSP